MHIVAEGWEGKGSPWAHSESGQRSGWFLIAANKVVLGLRLYCMSNWAEISLKALEAWRMRLPCLHLNA